MMRTRIPMQLITGARCEVAEPQPDRSLARVPSTPPATHHDALLRALLAQDPALEQRAATILAHSRAQGLSLTQAGWGPLFAGYRMAQSPASDWVLVNGADDPLITEPGGLPAPRAARRQLRRLARSGLRFDAVYLAHELPPGRLWPGQPLSRAVLQPAPAAAAQRGARLIGTLARGAWSGILAPMILLAAIAPRIAPVAAPFDPVVLGVIVAPGRPIAVGEPAAWFVLAQWWYAQENDL